MVLSVKMKKILFFISFVFSLSILQSQNINKVIKRDLSFCNYEFREPESADISSTLSFVEDTIAEIPFYAYSKNLSGKKFNSDNCCTKRPQFLNLYKNIIFDFDKRNMIVIVDGKNIKLEEDIDYPTYMPQTLTYFENDNNRHLMFQLDNYSSISSYYSRFSYTTILFKLDKQNEVIDQFIYVSAEMEEPKSVIKRYKKMTNDLN